jgi:hypothetical protein
MPAPRPRYDRYGRPLPTLAPTPSRREIMDSETNVGQREHILRRVAATLDDHYPHLLRENVTAEVTVSFKVVRGTLQGEVYVGVLRLYHPEEE